MAVNPTTFDIPQAYSSFDFTPLAQLGQQMKAKNDANTLAALASQYGDVNSTGQLGASITPGGGGNYAGPPGGGDNYSKAISSIESGGRYDLVGPQTSSGDRAYGKYQVMGANVPEWTRAALGKAMTPQEYLADTAAQEAVFKHRFGQYVEKYGPVGAAKAWFAGEGGMKNPNAKDLYGTTVSSYADKFVRNLGR